MSHAPLPPHQAGSRGASQAPLRLLRPTRMLSKEDLLVMSYSRSKAAGERQMAWGAWGGRVGVPSGLGKELEGTGD